MRRLCVALLCGLLLEGCFFSLDGSLVNKKRDGGGDAALLDGVLDGVRDGEPPHPDLPATDTSPPEAALPDAAAPDLFPLDQTASP
jgi:hypothetical protein